MGDSDCKLLTLKFWHTLSFIELSGDETRSETLTDFPSTSLLDVILTIFILSACERRLIMKQVGEAAYSRLSDTQRTGGE